MRLCLELPAQVDHFIQSLLLQAPPPAPLPGAPTSLAFYLFRAKRTGLLA